MQRVRTCDFCGENATGVYEPYPPSIPDPPRLLLCDGCRDRLASIVEPLLGRVDEGGATPGAESSSSSPDPDRGASDSDRDEDDPGGSTPDPVVDEPSTGDGDSIPDADSPPVGDSTDAGGRPTSERAGTPPNYRKVMRFLENRQLPVDRDEAERLAAKAYEIDPDDVADAIDHAVSYGRLREVGGELKR